MSYTTFHLSRKVISVVKPVLIECDNVTDTCTSWIDEINGKMTYRAKRMEGTMDSAFLFSYAAFMFASGFVAERMNLRYFLSIGMILSGVFTFLFGFAKVVEIHSIYYFITVQVFAGAFQSSGWPGVVTAVANWFGKSKKGLIFGIWNSHTSLGNILGSLIAGAFVEDDWGLSFMVPGMIVGAVGFIIWLFMVPKPTWVGLEDESSDEDGASHSNSGFEPEPKGGQNEVESARDVRSPQVEVQEPNEQAISIFGALKIPGVIEFSLCLFFAKLVSYTFLYWLPTFIKESGKHIDASTAANLSTLFDVGGILGGIAAGLISDITGKPASTCAVMLIAAIPSLFAYHAFGHACPLDDDNHDHCYTGNVGLLILSGFMVNGPYALITTAVSAELGVHPSLQGSSKALATVTAIIDGTGSIGAAVGPFLAGAIDGLDNIFYMLMTADCLALIVSSI